MYAIVSLCAYEVLAGRDWLIYW